MYTFRTTEIEVLYKSYLMLSGGGDDDGTKFSGGKEWT